jgi:peptide/nickel transport system ATP-binding protein
MLTERPLLELKDLHVSYKVYEGFLRVLNGIAIEIQRGERIGLIGEAGCGKTTLLKSIAMILPVPPARVDKGVISFMGTDIFQNEREGVGIIRKGVSMIFQDPTASLNPTLTIRTLMSDIIKSQK